MVFFGDDEGKVVRFVAQDVTMSTLQRVFFFFSHPRGVHTLSRRGIFSAKTPHRLDRNFEVIQ